MNDTATLARAIATRLGVERGIVEGQSAISGALKGWPARSTRNSLGPNDSAKAATTRATKSPRNDASISAHPLAQREPGQQNVLPGAKAFAVRDTRQAVDASGACSTIPATPHIKLTMMGPKEISGVAGAERWAGLSKNGAVFRKSVRQESGHAPASGVQTGAAAARTAKVTAVADMGATMSGRPELAMGARTARYGAWGQSALAMGRNRLPTPSATLPFVASSQPTMSVAPAIMAATRPSQDDTDRGAADQGSVRQLSYPTHPSEQMDGPAAAGGDTGSARHIEGDVYLDGALMGRWLTRTLAQEAGRAPSGGTAFDPRRNAFPAGVMIGG